MFPHVIIVIFLNYFDIILIKFLPFSVYSYHQKYRLQDHPWLLETLGLTSSELIRISPLAAKLNGYLAGAVTYEQFQRDLPSLGLSDKVAQYVEKFVIEKQNTGLYC